MHAFTLIFTQKSGHPVKLHSLSFQTQQENNNTMRNVFWYGYKIFQCIPTNNPQDGDESISSISAMKNTNQCLVNFQ